MFKKLAAWIAGIGQNIQFVAFFAHCFTTAYLISATTYGEGRLIVAGLVVVAGAIKEFWFDAKYEKNPPQTWVDNLSDFIGWCLGAFLGVIS